MDEQTYLQRVSQCERSLYRVARSILWNDMDCADAIQQAVFKGWVNRRRLREPERFQAWLTRILVNECRNLQRHSQRQGRIAGALEDRLRADATAPPANPSLAEALRGLPEHYRMPIVLHYIEGYPVREVARILGVTEKRATDCLYRGRKKLREALEL